MLDKIAGVIFGLLWDKLKQEAEQSQPKVIAFVKAQFAEWKPEILAFIKAQFAEWMPAIIKATVVATAESAKRYAVTSVDKVTDQIPGTLDDQILDPIVDAVFGQLEQFGIKL